MANFNPLRFDSLTKEDQDKAIQIAQEWGTANSKRIHDMVKGAKQEFPPNGSDIFHPESWKAPIWKWFLNRPKS